MRKIFETQRLETVEGVARLLNEHGIQTKITNGRSYRGGHRHDFSFVHPERAPMPAVWVIRADDQHQARQLLRDAGMMDSVCAVSSYLPAGSREPTGRVMPESAASKWALRIRILLIVAVVVLALQMVFGMIG